jgi:hypothetical protein
MGVIKVMAGPHDHEKLRERLAALRQRIVTGGGGAPLVLRAAWCAMTHSHAEPLIRRRSCDIRFRYFRPCGPPARDVDRLAVASAGTNFAASSLILPFV